MIYVNKIENGIMFKMKTGYYLELLTPESMKLLGSTKSKITKNKNCKNVAYIEITEEVLIHCNIVTMLQRLSARFKSLVCICSK